MYMCIHSLHKLIQVCTNRSRLQLISNRGLSANQHASTFPRPVCGAGTTPPASQHGNSSNGASTEKRLFSNLNPRTLKHDPGSVFGSAMLVAGTTIGAGILALPAVTQEAGFVPSAATLTVVCLFSAATGLLIAEVNLTLMRERGAGGVSLISMARETLGGKGALASSAAYVFLHYALLVAYISKAGEIIADTTGAPLVPSAALFAGAFALLCYASSQKLLDQLNGVLVALVVGSFLGLLGVAGSGVDAGSLLHDGDWGAVPATLPVVALAFVYHNIIPVISQALEGDVAKIRTAVMTGLAIPWLMFVSWEGAILGSLGALQTAADTAREPTAIPAVAMDMQQLRPAVASVARQPAASTDAWWPPPPHQQQQQQQQQQQYLVSRGVLHQAALQSRDNGRLLVQAPTVHAAEQKAQQQHSLQQQHWQQQQQATQFAGMPGSKQMLPAPLSDSLQQSISTSSSLSEIALPVLQPVIVESAAAAEGMAAASSSSTVVSHVADPLAALSAANPAAAPLIKGFSFLAIGTSYIGFILGLTDFLADALKLPSGRQSPLPYVLTILPPFAVAVTNPNIFLQALDTAGTYGVLTLFGIQPAAMAWSARYSDTSSTSEQVERQQIIPGGRFALLAIGGAAAGVILNEVLQLAANAPLAGLPVPPV